MQLHAIQHLMASYAVNVHNMSIDAVPPHVPDGFSRCDAQTDNIDFEDVSPFLSVSVVNRVAVRDAGVVDEDVDGSDAPGEGEGLEDGGFRRHVAGEGVEGALRVAERFGDGVQEVRSSRQPDYLSFLGN